jgi:AcrR family transcriptional regulator
MIVLGLAITGSDVLAVPDRDRILEAMADCCAEAGYAETTVDAVLQRAGVGIESFQAHFSGKEDCALAALNKIISETLARISMAASKGGGPFERRAADVRAMLELLAAQPGFAWLGFVEARHGGTPRMHSSYESATGLLALMMERAGEVEGAREGAARAALGGAEAVLRRELVSGRGRGLPKLLEDFVYIALVPFMGQREALRQAKQAARVAAGEG